MADNNVSAEDFVSLVSKVFSTESGQQLLKLLKFSYMLPTVVSSTPELTYYRLGQKELVEMLNDAFSDPDFGRKVEVQVKQEEML